MEIDSREAAGVGSEGDGYLFCLCSSPESMGFPSDDIGKDTTGIGDKGGRQTPKRQSRSVLAIRLRMRAGLPASSGWGIVGVNKSEQKDRHQGRG